ncbi:MAG: N-6 DNA methylase [Candidatus Riflebacteria bacterium]|nr:N-6 DNA methylase [Candidatus Riflebacteria bacterium]
MPNKKILELTKFLSQGLQDTANLSGRVEIESAEVLENFVCWFTVYSTFVILCEKSGVFSDSFLSLRSNSSSREIWTFFRNLEKKIASKSKIGSHCFPNAFIELFFQLNPSICTKFFEKLNEIVFHYGVKPETLGNIFEALIDIKFIKKEEKSSNSLIVPVISENRRKSGSHYTPPELAREIVKEAIEAYTGTNSHHIDSFLNLRICDISAGSGVFLLSAARLLEEIVASNQDNPCFLEIRKKIVENCLYGADKNSMAVEVCRLSLWLYVADSEFSSSILESRVKFGDSLVGTPFIAGLSLNKVELEAVSPHILNWEREFPEIFENGGFDIIVGNPPFQGSQKITMALGKKYKNYLAKFVAAKSSGLADLSAYFFLRAFQLLKAEGIFGLIATNSIGQGGSKKVGLERIIGNGGSIFKAISSMKWPGDASLEVAIVWMKKGGWSKKILLDGKNVLGIHASLTPHGTIINKPGKLPENSGKCFTGLEIMGGGFLLPASEAEKIISQDSKYKKVLFPYLNGEDINSKFDQNPSRYAINFSDWPLTREYPISWNDLSNSAKEERLKEGKVSFDFPHSTASDFPICFKTVTEKVFPARKNATSGKNRQFWWKYASNSKSLYEAISQLPRVLAISLTTKFLCFSFFPTNYIFSILTKVFPFSDFAHFSILSSIFHEIWVSNYCSTLENRLRYTSTEVFDTFAFPQLNDQLEIIGKEFYQKRQKIMYERKIGLTGVYNLVHDKKQKSQEIRELRELQFGMDFVTASAYNWKELDLKRDFFSTKQGERLTISSSAREAILEKLLRLNLEKSKNKFL